MRPDLSAAQLLAIARLSMSPANPLPVRQRGRLQPDPWEAMLAAAPPPGAVCARRQRDLALIAAALAKRARKGQHLRHCAERGGFGARPFVGA